ncbi:hypothetical protein [Desulfovirgula thermocuniculi]|uniref:recombination directionality factor n=1 Tax=Desulfovirgula thermocuniculi TaxID=348842 RepID=UPI000551496B|nr:hypothetical protein [Desulfovirgula thermocuniculi]
MPIKGWTDIPVRFPRLGTIALGVKNEEGYPVAVDYFVVPPEVQAVYGPQPRELDVMFPAEDFNVIASAWLKRYGDQFGLICRGDGETATLAGNYGKLEEYGVTVRGGVYRMRGREEAALETEKNGGRTWVKIPCTYQQCRFYAAGKCREVVILSVILPKVPGVLGVYSLDTGSINSYRNIRDALMMLKAMIGRFSFVPLKLRVRMEEKRPMLADGRQVRRKVPILYIDMGDMTLLKMFELARTGQLTTSIVLPPTPSNIEIEPPDEDKKPELLYEPLEEPLEISEPEQHRKKPETDRKGEEGLFSNLQPPEIEADGFPF